jgi:tetratricopeptide (TPR) repeat protein
LSLNQKSRFIIVLLSIVAGAGVARADEASDARHHFEEGSKRFHLGEFKRAAEEYKAAYAAKPDPVLLYNVAQAYRLGNEPAQALFFYRSFLNSQPDSPNRLEIEDRIHKLEAEIALQKSQTAPVTKPAVELAAPAAATVTPQTTATTNVPLTVNASAPRDKSTPVYKKWWLWTIVGVAVAGAAVGVSVGLVASAKTTGAPASHFGTLSF